MKVKFAKDVFIRQLDDGTSMVLRNGQIFHVNGLAATVLERMYRKEDVNLIAERLAHSTGAGIERIESDIRKFVGELRRLGLVLKV